MRVLFLRTDACVFDPRIQKESASLNQAGYDVSVFGWDRKSEFAQEEVVNGVTYLRTRIPAPYGSKLLLFVLPLFWIRAALYIMDVHPDVVHACDWDALVPAILVKPFVRQKIVYDIFDNFADKITGIPSIVRSLIRKIDHISMRCVDFVIVADDHRRSLLGNIASGSVGVIMNVPPENHFVTTSAEGRPVRVCYAGVIHEHRGLRLIAEATKGLDGIEVQFAGWIPRTVDSDFIRSQAHIQYRGKLSYSESLELLSQSDIIMALYDPDLPINAMASSNKIYEAMSVKRPVITNMETTMARIIREEKCGCLISYGDVEGLRATIIRLRDNLEMRQRLGESGYKAFQEKYNWTIMEERLKNIYAHL